jgi:hypothetical protein
LTPKQQGKLADKKQHRIVKQLLYYDIFDHLLTEKELVKDCSLKGEPDNHFEELVNKGFIFKLNGYYSVRDDEALALKRKRGQENTLKTMPQAKKMAKLISNFPFVRAIALSGSISKGYMDSFKDIDYFIITKPGRLWLSRTMLVFYKKVFLLNSFKYFCLNYFIDENNLEIRNRNIFTATEINTLIPLYGTELVQSFCEKNAWVSDYYENYPRQEIKAQANVTPSRIKRILEFIFSGFPGNWLDILAMKFTVGYWKWKYRGDNRYLFDSSFRFRRDEAKYHPGNFEHPVMKKYHEKVNLFEKEKNLSLRNES